MLFGRNRNLAGLDIGESSIKVVELKELGRGRGYQVQRLGWEPLPDEDDRSRRLRGQVLGALGTLAEDPTTIERSRALYRRWRADRGDLDPDVAQAALFTTATHGDDATYEEMFSLYETAETPQDQLKLLRALTLFDRTTTVDRTLEAILDGRIRSQDSSWVVAGLFGGRRSGPHAWKRVRDRWEEVTATMPPMTIRRMVEGLPALSQPDIAADVEAFFATTDIPAAHKALTQALERLRVNRDLRLRETERLGRFLEERS